MKKSVFVTGLATMMGLAAAAQSGSPAAPPPPPKPPVVKQKKVPPPPPAEVPPAPPAPQKPQLPDEVNAFMERNPDVKGLDWQKGKRVIIRLKSGKEERYDLANAASRKALEERYGELPPPPPPPPAPPAPPAPPTPPKKKSTLS